MMLRMMKKSRIVLTLVCAMMVTMLATGCGEEKEAPIPVDLSSGNQQDGTEDLKQGTEDKASSQADGDRRSETDDQEATEDNSSQLDAKETGDNQSQIDDKTKDDNLQTGQTSGNEELVGNIKGDIGQDSFVLCKVESDGNVAIAAAPGAEEADDLVTVYVNPGCIYRYKTVRNGGINPEDISEREGSFGDLKDGLNCVLRGSWREGSFCADSIEMEEFM